MDRQRGEVGAISLADQLSSKSDPLLSCLWDILLDKSMAAQESAQASCSGCDPLPIQYFQRPSEHTEQGAMV